MSSSASWAKAFVVLRKSHVAGRNTLVKSSVPFVSQRNRELPSVMTVVFLCTTLGGLVGDTADLRERLLADTSFEQSGPLPSRLEKPLYSALWTELTDLEPFTGVGLANRTTGEKLECSSGHVEATLYQDLCLSRVDTAGSLELQVDSGRELGSPRVTFLGKLDVAECSKSLSALS